MDAKQIRFTEHPSQGQRGEQTPHHKGTSGVDETAPQKRLRRM